MAGGSLAPGQAGAPPNHRKRKAAAPAAAAEDGPEAEREELGREVEELEEGLADLDRRILEHLRGTATRLTDAAVARLAALRPPARLELPTSTESAEEDQEQLEKLMILKSKFEANIADLPKVLEKMNQSVVRFEKLESLNMNIHPVFRRKRL